MELNEYQNLAMHTCMESCWNIPYMLFNLQGEVGELSSKIAKAIRKEQLWFSDNEDGDHNEAYDCVNVADRADFDYAVKGEIGDVLWQLAGLCDVLGFTLQEVADFNLAKLADRKQRNVIDGNGDDR